MFKIALSFHVVTRAHPRPARSALQWAAGPLRQPILLTRARPDVLPDGLAFLLAAAHRLLFAADELEPDRAPAVGTPILFRVDFQVALEAVRDRDHRTSSVPLARAEKIMLSITALQQRIRQSMCIVTSWLCPRGASRPSPDFIRAFGGPFGPAARGVLIRPDGRGGRAYQQGKLGRTSRLVTRQERRLPRFAKSYQALARSQAICLKRLPKAPFTRDLRTGTR